MRSEFPRYNDERDAARRIKEDAIGRLDELKRSDCRSAVEGYFSTDRMVAEHIELFESMIS